MAWAWLRTGVAVGAAAFLGCGGSGLADFNNFADQYATAYCARSMACPGSPENGDMQCHELLFGTVDVCGQNAFSVGEEKYHSDQAQPCIDAIKTQGCSDLIAGVTPPACSLVYGLKAGEDYLCPMVIGGIDGSNGAVDLRQSD